jgi:hypothetical protein
MVGRASAQVVKQDIGKSDSDLAKLVEHGDNHDLTTDIDAHSRGSALKAFIGS